MCVPRHLTMTLWMPTSKKLPNAVILYNNESRKIKSRAMARLLIFHEKDAFFYFFTKFVAIYVSFSYTC